MTHAPIWEETTSVGTLRADQLARAGVVFRYGHHLYRTLGQHLSQGGMGTVHIMERCTEAGAPVETVVGKTFHANYLYQLRTDEVTRRDHHTNLAAVARLATLEHPSLLPMYVSAPIADNYLFVTPKMGPTLLEAISKHKLTPRARTQLLIQSLEGLERLHDARMIHRDFTLRNVLLDDRATAAYLFDFDLAMSFDDVGATTYRVHYRGRVFGSPGYSVPPETIEPALMDAPLSTALDIFAAGGALHALFTDQLPYGPTDDMWGLLVKIAEGVVVGGKSKVHYPDAVPRALRPIIERCLEREPSARYPRVATLIGELRNALGELDDGRADSATFDSATHRQPPVDPERRIDSVLASRGDDSIGKAVIQHGEQAVATWGYQIQQALGRVKGHPIFVAVPRQDLLAAGQFPDANTYPKLVTIINLHAVPNPRQLVEHWQQYFLPTLKKVRTGLMTTLHKVVYDAQTGTLLLFSEFIDDPRFGTALAAVDLPIDGGLALAFLVVRQVAALHENGMAHNNVHHGALLFKGVSESRTVYPAMIGLVEPSLAPEAKVADVRALAAMVMAWIKPARVLALNQRARPAFEDVRARLATCAYDSGTTPGIDELMAAVSDGLALVDFNFSVLRDAGGDLQDHALLLVSHRLYHHLWSERAAAPSPS